MYLKILFFPMMVFSVIHQK